MDFKGTEQPILRYLGAQYRLDEYCPEVPRAPRELAVSMRDYYASAVERFVEEHGKALPRVTSPYIPDNEWSSTWGGTRQVYRDMLVACGDFAFRQ